jgi:prepilin-type N-terminal cleavage/methylation domain-containing protein
MNGITKNKSMKKNESGFTLVELLIALTLLAVLILAVTGMLSGLPRFYRDLRGEEEGEEEVWTALNFMAWELRSARKFKKDSTEKRLIFVDENNQQITYSYDTGNKELKRQAGAATGVPVIGDIRAGDWEITYHVNDVNDPARFTQITLQLKEGSITIQPRMYKGVGPDSNGWCE